MLGGTARRAARRIRPWLGGLALVAALTYVVAVVDAGALREAAAGLADAPLALAAAMVIYAGAFGLRAAAWRRTLPALTLGQSWAALHVSLLGNHVLPLRLGEVLRVTSVLRRTGLPARLVLASAVTLRLGDVVAVVALAALAAPALLGALVGMAGTAVLAGALLLALTAAYVWAHRIARGSRALRAPGPCVASAIVVAWLLEAAIVWTVAGAAGVPLTVPEAIGVTAVTMLAQTVAVTPAGVGTYEAAGTAALVLLGVDAGPALAVVVLTHALKSAYAIVIGGLALVVPTPGYFGRWRLPRRAPERPPPRPVGPDAPVVAFIPAHNEETTVASVVRRLPGEVAGRRVEVIVVDDGSTDATANRAAEAGAHVVRMSPNRGLGAAVRRGLAEAVAREPACVVYLDADLEYIPEDLPALAGPVLDGSADYVVGSRFAGQIEVMRPHRRFGNRVLTAWVRWMTRRRDLTDGQSGYRAFSSAAAAGAEVVHDYNYAQVLTLDLLGKGFRYAEVPIRYSFRTSGDSFVRLGGYLRRVVPAVHRELNAVPARRSILDDVAAEPLAGR
jgi:uncharacterized membrane protein YbhN (UPF0104 family)